MNRRNFLNAAGLSLGFTAMPGLNDQLQGQTRLPEPEYRPRMKFGFVTYLWGKDMKLPDLIKACESSGLLGVETRTEHAHGVEPELTASQRDEVRKRFADSPVRLIGYGSNCQFHDAEPEKLQANILQAKKYIRLMHDCGGTGLKVKPNGFPKNVDRRRTIEQIGKALNEIATYGDDYGQEIRVEVHGSGTSDLEVMKSIFDVADHPNARVCWNSNNQDLAGKGLEHNFGLVSKRFGATAHVRELDSKEYPYQQLFNHFAGMQYSGWVLLEARTNPVDKVAAMKYQKGLFDKLYINALAASGKASGAARL